MFDCGAQFAETLKRSFADFSCVTFTEVINILHLACAFMVYIGICVVLH